MDSLTESIDEAVRTVLNRREEKIVLPRRCLDIPRHCLAVPRPRKIAVHTADFLALLDGAVRKAPVEGVSLEDACKLMHRIGRTIKPNSLITMLARNPHFHVLTIQNNRVRLSAKDALDRIDRKFRKIKT